MENCFKITESGAIKTSLRGMHLLRFPLLNKGTAFTEEERTLFKLRGLLPFYNKTIEEQANHLYDEYKKCHSDITKHVFLRALQDRNTTLFYYLLTKHIEEMMPIIYTPVVGQACRQFGQIFRQSHGLYISYPDRDHIEMILRNAANDRVKVIVVTDGERVLGLGDLGVGGMGIPIGKLSLYTICGGIDPAITLPIILDVGTNNQELLRDFTYFGWPHKRIEEADYEKFIELFISAVDRVFPGVLLQFEDFAQPHAYKLLERYRNRLCCFNDDIQGTAAIALGITLSAVNAVQSRLQDQRVAIFGAGSAGCGIANQLVIAMQKEGLSESEALNRFYLIDRQGLLIDDMSLLPFQKPFAQSRSAVSQWGLSNSKHISLLDVVRNAHPTVLIGVSGQRDAFTKEIIRTMAKEVDRPIIFPMSNPNSQAEATPTDLIHWTKGRALIATGSPFKPVQYKGETYPIAQSNNCYIFPGVGLGVIVSGAKRISDEMFRAAAIALSEEAKAHYTENGGLLPNLSHIQEVSLKVAFAVALEAQKEGLAPKEDLQVTKEKIKHSFWHPVYRKLIP